MRFCFFFTETILWGGFLSSSLCRNLSLRNFLSSYPWTNQDVVSTCAWSLRSWAKRGTKNKCVLVPSSQEFLFSSSCNRPLWKFVLRHEFVHCISGSWSNCNFLRCDWSVASNLIKINQGEKKEEHNQWQTRFSHIFICPILRRAALIKFTWKRWCLCFKLQNIPSGSLSERERKSSRNLCPAVANSCGFQRSLDSRLHSIMENGVFKCAGLVQQCFCNFQAPWYERPGFSSRCSKLGSWDFVCFLSALLGIPI